MDRLDKRKPISSELVPIMEQAVRITRAVNMAARTIESHDDGAFKKTQGSGKEDDQRSPGYRDEVQSHFAANGKYCDWSWHPKDCPDYR